MGANQALVHIPKTEENKSIATWRPNSIGMKTSKSVEKRREIKKKESKNKLLKKNSQI